AEVHAANTRCRACRAVGVAVIWPGVSSDVNRRVHLRNFHCHSTGRAVVVRVAVKCPAYRPAEYIDVSGRSNMKQTTQVYSGNARCGTGRSMRTTRIWTVIGSDAYVRIDLRNHDLDITAGIAVVGATRERPVSRA